MRSNHREEIDGILNTALTSYSVKSPRCGLEQRVLNRVRYEDRYLRKSWLRPVVILASACLLFAIVSIPDVWKPVPHRSGVVTGAKLVQTLPPIPAAADLRNSETSKLSGKRERPSAQKIAQKQRRLPKLDLFPSPTPLTGEEHALLVLAKFPPEKLPKGLLRASDADEQPIQIEPLKIDPL